MDDSQLTAPERVVHELGDLVVGGRALGRRGLLGQALVECDEPQIGECERGILLVVGRCRHEHVASNVRGRSSSHENSIRRGDRSIDPTEPLE